MNCPVPEGDVLGLGDVFQSFVGHVVPQCPEDPAVPQGPGDPIVPQGLVGPEGPASFHRKSTL